MNIRIFYILFIFFISLNVNSQEGMFDFETEFPISMSMTPLIDLTKSNAEEISLDVLSVSNEHYNINCITHAIKNFSYGVVLRLEDGLPVEKSMSFFRDLSFFDVSWNYEFKNFNFNFSVSNILNFRDSILELEPYLERQSLVAEEIYFSHESTSNVQVAIQYRF